jgi:hypothetical protein
LFLVRVLPANGLLQPANAGNGVLANVELNRALRDTVPFAFRQNAEDSEGQRRGGRPA